MKARTREGTEPRELVARLRAKGIGAGADAALEAMGVPLELPPGYVWQALTLRKPRAEDGSSLGAGVDIVCVIRHVNRAAGPQISVADWNEMLDNPVKPE